MKTIEKPPSRIFIVPYRNRPQQKFFFTKYMSYILEDCDDYEIYFSHQSDDRSFNRGATKNIGFLAIKNKYPHDYKDITFIFNDLDIVPFYKIFDYETTYNTVKHYYGFKNTLGGIVVIKGIDFEKINGFPCFWGWGLEDNVLQKRCEYEGLNIDRSTFYDVGSPEILHLFDGISRIITKNDNWKNIDTYNIDGLQTITELNYTINDKSYNEDDNIFTMNNPRIMVINITHFLTHIPFMNDNYYIYDLRKSQTDILKDGTLKKTNKVVVTTNDWLNIPQQPNSIENKKQMVKYLVSIGQPVPESLLREIANEKKEFSRNTREPFYNNNINTINNNQHKSPFFNKFNYNQINKTQPIPNKYSPNYASYMGVKPRASPSVRIGMGGAY